MLAGNVAALLSPVVISVVLTYAIGSQRYDYKSMQSIRQVEETTGPSDPEQTIYSETKQPVKPEDEQQQQQLEAREAEAKSEERKLNRAALYSRTLTIVMVLCFLILWPIPMYASSYVFSKPFFTGWVVVGIIWLFFTTFGVVVFPLVEGRQSIFRVVRMMSADIMRLVSRG